MLSDVSSLSPIDRLIYWIKERESVRLKKEAGEPKPWTDDAILQKYRFCNVRRMDDKVSQWLLHNWYEPFHDHPNMLIACCLARFFNLPSSLEAIGFPEVWDAAKVRSVLRRLKKQGKTIFNAAYMVRGNDGVDKVACVINYSIQPLVKHPPIIDTSSMQNTWKALECRRGFGSFMAGQVVADLRWGLSGSWEDKGTWAPIGPGSKRGMNILLGRELESPITQSDFNIQLNNLMLDLRIRLLIKLTGRLEAIDYQNCLCEYSGYEKVLWGRGRKKQLYPGLV